MFFFIVGGVDGLRSACSSCYATAMVKIKRFVAIFDNEMIITTLSMLHSWDMAIAFLLSNYSLANFISVEKYTARLLNVVQFHTIPCPIIKRTEEVV